MTHDACPPPCAACVSGEPVIALNLLASADANGFTLSQYLDLPDVYGCTPALLAARCAYARPPNLSGLLHCVSLCLYRGASAQAASTSDGRTVLFFLAALGAVDLITQVRPPCSARALTWECGRRPQAASPAA